MNWLMDTAAYGVAALWLLITAPLAAPASSAPPAQAPAHAVVELPRPTVITSPITSPAPVHRSYVVSLAALPPQSMYDACHSGAVYPECPPEPPIHFISPALRLTTTADVTAYACPLGIPSCWPQQGVPLALIPEGTPEVLSEYDDVASTGRWYFIQGGPGWLPAGALT